MKFCIDIPNTLVAGRPSGMNESNHIVVGVLQLRGIYNELVSLSVHNTGRPTTMSWLVVLGLHLYWKPSGPLKTLEF
jgi:hypothetical protein